MTVLDRRTFLGLAAVAAPAIGLAQPSPPRIALVLPQVAREDIVGAQPAARPVRVFLQALSDLGYVEGRSIVVERHTLEGHTERAPTLFAELIGRRIQLLVVSTNALASAARHATATIPIVMLAADPVEDGLVASLSHPGGNVTGVDWLPSAAFSQKWLQLLKEAAPTVARVAALTGPRAPNPKLVARQMRELEEAARMFRLALVWAEIPRVEAMAERLATLLPQRPDALLAVNSATLTMGRRQLIAFATQHRLPSVGPLEVFAQDGALMSYGGDPEESWARLADYAVRILRGARPGDLPIQQPTRFELVLNLKTARALGLRMPESLLLRATRTIE